MATFPTTPAVLGTKASAVAADTLLISDSADSNKGKVVTLAVVKAFTTYINVDTTPYPAAGFSIIIANDDAAAASVTLPAVATSAGLTYTIKKEGSSGNITVSGSGAENIDGANTAVLTTQYESITVVCDGVEWWII